MAPSPLLELYLQDDGLAFRHLASAAPTSLQIPMTSRAWLQEYSEPSHTGPSYEEPYRQLEAGTPSRGRSWLGSWLNPLLGTSGLQVTGADGWALPALFRSAEGVFILLAESGLELGHDGHHLRQRGTHYRFTPPPPDQGLSEKDREDLPKPPLTPWRLVMVGDLGTLFASTLVTDVASPMDRRFHTAGTEWIRPGRLAWDWWTHLETGPPERQRRHIDFAAEMGFEFVLIDANWHRWPGAEEEIRHLVRYGTERGVGVVLWYNSGGPNNEIGEGPRDRMHERSIRQTELAKLALWGVAGIKVDFWHSDRAVRIAAYIELLEDAAENGLMVNVHGSTVPRGWRRRFPNLMTYEAVRGAEFYRFPVLAGPSALDHVRYSLIRNVVGAMDYTPIVFEAARRDSELPWIHSLALGVLFESAWQHLADTADDPKRGYRAAIARFPFLRPILSELPASWDESILLDADPDHHVILARRRGQTWWIAGIHAGDSGWKTSIDLTPIASTDDGATCDSVFRAQWVEQGERPQDLVSRQRDLPCRLDLELQARGGFLAIVRGQQAITANR